MKYRVKVKRTIKSEQVFIIYCDNSRGARRIALAQAKYPSNMHMWNHVNTSFSTSKEGTKIGTDSTADNRTE